MKRFLVFFIAIAMMLGCAIAEIDLSEMNYEELVELQKKINIAIWESEGWQSVKVTPGIYEIGIDIPAGKWVIRPIEGHSAYVTIGASLNNDGTSVRQTWYEYIESPTSSGYQSNDTESVTVIITKGYIQIGWASVIFEPFVGAGFAFN